jgi:hypothetical protein
MLAVNREHPSIMFNSEERRRVKRAFEGPVDSKTVESFLNGGPQPLKRGRIDYIITFVGGTEPEQVSERIAKVAELAIQHGAAVHHLVGALAILAFGTQAVSSPAPGNRPSLVAALHQQLGPDIKIVHGAADGCSGLFGARSGLSYTFFVPQFDRALGVLSRLPLGAVEEFRA